MAKKFGKFLVFTAVAAAAGAGVMALYKKYKEQNEDYDYDDFDWNYIDFPRYGCLYDKQRKTCI